MAVDPQRKALMAMPNVGPAFAADLILLGITEASMLKGQDPVLLYEKLCTVTGVRHDPCVLDTFRAVVHFVETGESRKWWEFTSLRKAR